MGRLARISTIWRKELTDTLRDRRTLIAMVLVPIILYPALMIGSLQGFELQISRLKQEKYKIGVISPRVAEWLQGRIDTDLARQPGAQSLPAEELVARAERGELPAPTSGPAAGGEGSAADKARMDVRRRPPPYEIVIVPRVGQLRALVAAGELHVGLLIDGDLPAAAGDGSTAITLVFDQTEIRSQIAAAGLEGIFDRAGEHMLRERLRRAALEPSFVRPLDVREETVATPEKVGGSILGQIVPLILIIMTITGAIYPAIDLTAGERERGTLETLMVAPVPTVDLIAGKFVVVALIGMISAGLNLLSIGGTIYLGGLGNLLTQGNAVQIPLRALPLVLLLLIPLAVMFSALLLAVCSFARSFKEAQNYVMPVMIAALIPAVVGVLPGTRLEGPLLVMPVTNIVILTRDLFTGRFELLPILWVGISTTLYAGAAVAVAAKLFGQEAVLFADSGSIKTIFQRRFFKPAEHPSVAQALLLLAIIFSLNFFMQQRLLTTPGLFGTTAYWCGLAAVLVVMFLALPLGAARYMRVAIPPTFGLSPPPLLAGVAGLCFGLSTWVLARVWFAFQSTWLSLPAGMEAELAKLEGVIAAMPPWQIVVVLALVPAVCEEFFFRGYALAGLRGGLGKVAAVLITSLAFGIHHHSVFRLAIAAGLGLVLGLLVVQWRSIWPAILVHLMHNTLTALADRADGLKPLLDRLGCVADSRGLPPPAWIIGALVLTTIGILLCLLGPRRDHVSRIKAGEA